jgi:hypothetical protein
MVGLLDGGVEDDALGAPATWGLQGYRLSVADVMIDLSVAEGESRGGAAPAVAALNDVDGVDGAVLGWNEAGAERLDVEGINQGLASATLVLATAGLTVSQAEGVLKKLRGMLTEWSALRSAWVELRSGDRVSVADLTAEQLAEESTEG